MKTTLVCEGKSIKLNAFAEDFLANVLHGAIVPLRDVPREPDKIVVQRDYQDLSIMCDLVEIEWFMAFSKNAVRNVLDAAVQSLKGCEQFNKYRLEVSK
ncbi:MAG: hypothetical protein GXP49_13130 [Deltaproteobacteria bacterium]|nr:hypothetical protein [Deltaproteobacteria bacterium]